jgi:hypothetical protein
MGRSGAGLLGELMRIRCISPIHVGERQMQREVMGSISRTPAMLSRRTLLSGGIAAGIAGVRPALIDAQESHPPMTEATPTPVEKMQRVLKAVELFGELVPSAKDARGASGEEIAQAERLLGHSLPETMRQLYLAHDGSQRIVTCWPLIADGDDALSVVRGSAGYRIWHWPVPTEMMLFADDGSESALGLWKANESEIEPIVVELGECFEEPCLAVVGDDLASFLLGRAAIYFVLEGSDWNDTGPMIEALGIPVELRKPGREFIGTTQDIHGNSIGVEYVGEEAYLDLIRWANPGLPDPDPDPYRRSWSVDQINEFVASRGR